MDTTTKNIRGKRSRRFAFVAAAALLLISCGSSDNAAPSGSPTTAAQTDPSIAATIPAESGTTTVAPAAEEAPCSAIMSADEFASLMGRPVDLTGSAANCFATFADDAVGTMSVLSGSQADELLATFIGRFETDSYYQTNGTLLDDDRGFFLDGKVAVRGASGNLFQVAIPESAGIENLDEVSQQIADLLLPR